MMNGVYNLTVSVIAADLGTHQTLKGIKGSKKKFEKFLREYSGYRISIRDHRWLCQYWYCIWTTWGPRFVPKMGLGETRKSFT